MTDHQAIEAEHHERMNELGHLLSAAFEGCGFCLLVFPLNDAPGRMNYICNADRKDMLVAMKEFIAKNEGRSPKAPAMKQ